MTKIDDRFSPTVRLRKVLRALRRWRAEARLDQVDVAKALDWSPARVSRLERGETVPGPAEVLALAAIYGRPDGERDEYVALSLQARQKGWWRRYGPAAWAPAFEEYIGLESEASEVRNFELDVIPGLLQLGDYAAALARKWVPSADEDTVKSRAELREARQGRLRGTTPLRLHAVIGETAIRQVVGGKETMLAQLEHLLRMMDQAHTVVQVVTFDAGAYPASGCPFTLLSFPDPEEDDVVYIGTLSSSVYEEDAPDVEQYSASFLGLQDVALSADESVAYVGRILEDLRNR